MTKAQDRFDKLLKAMAEGEPPKRPQAAKGEETAKDRPQSSPASGD